MEFVSNLQKAGLTLTMEGESFPQERKERSNNINLLEKKMCFINYNTKAV